MTSLERLSDFALSLRRESNIEGSSVCSPLSIGLVLALLNAGANGATKTQIAHALAKGATDDEVQKLFEMVMTLSSPPKVISNNDDTATNTLYKPRVSGKVEIELANRLYVRSDISIEPLYLETIKKNYDAVAQIIDFSNSGEAVKTINSFVATTTKGKISNLLSSDSISTDTAALAVNAVYFKGDWMHPFRPRNTNQRDFFAGNGVTREVQMMYQSARFKYAETDEVQVLSMKYVDESCAYDVFLPKENFAGGLDAFLAGLTGTKMQTLFNSVEFEKVNVSLPKATIETTQNLKSTLEKMGIKDVFGSTADLTGISKDEAKPLYVAQIATKCFIEVEEFGTAAAAAAYVHYKTKGPSPPPKIFNANRPYFFVLTKDGAPLFTGVY